MSSSKPFIHLFRTYGGKYLYDVNRNDILSLNDEEYDIIEYEMKHWDNTDSIRRISQNRKLKRLMDGGYLAPSSISEIIHPVDKSLETHLNNRVRMIILQVTQQCNLRCEYCVYSGMYENRVHTGRRMEFEAARKAIDFLLEHSKDVPDVNIGFYGGEPLLEFELMKKCVKYAKGKFEGKNLTINFTTNGTLITREIADFISENKIRMLISLDGPKNIHDKNRKFAFNNCGTFDTIMKNIEFLVRDYPQYKEHISFNTVIDPTMDMSCANEFFTGFDTIKEFRQTHSAQFIADRNIKDNEKFMNSIAFEKGWSYEVFKLYLSKLGNIGINRISSLVQGQYSRLEQINYRFGEISKKILKCHHGGPCIPGVTRLFVDVEGNFFPCERVSEASEVMKIGNLEFGFDIVKVRNLLNVGKLTEEKCKRCWAIFHCNLCASAADDGEELSAAKKELRCREERRVAEIALMDICSLKEMGHYFDEDAGMTVMNI